MRILFSLLICFFATNATAAPIKYAVDTQNTDVNFTYTFGGKPIQGAFNDYQIDVEIDFQALKNSCEFGSNHTDCILTEDDGAAERFFQRLDSAILMRNASTQFADGGEFGMGAEIGIATGKMHARGPVGAAQLTSFKYLVDGDGTVRG